MKNSAAEALEGVKKKRAFSSYLRIFATHANRCSFKVHRSKRNVQYTQCGTISDLEGILSNGFRVIFVDGTPRLDHQKGKAVAAHTDVLTQFLARFVARFLHLAIFFLSRLVVL